LGSKMFAQRSTCAVIRVFRCFLIALLVVALGSCGGVTSGPGSATSNPSSTPPASTPGATTPTSSPTPSPGTGSPSPTPTPSVNSGAEFLYAVTPAANDQSTFTVYQIDQNTGQLTQLTTATIPVRAAQNMAVDSSGRNFYVTGFEAPGANMDLIKVDPSTHDIMPLPGQTFHTLPAFSSDGDCCPNTVAVDAAGKFAYVGGLNDGSIHVYSVDQSSGTWTEISPSNSQPASGGGPVYTGVMHPTNKFLYESQRASSFVNIWTRNQNGGLISPNVGSPFQTAALTSSVSVSADGKFLFAPQYETSHVSVYLVNSDGTLAAITGSPLTAGNAPSRAVADPQDRFIFVLNSGAYNGGPASVQSFTLDQKTGAINQVANSTFTVFQVSEIRVDANGKFLYAVGGQTMAWSIDQTTGALTPVPGSPFKIAASDTLILPQTTAGTQ
jgi:6-phosphogluconolactonase (cycloisomerase 2 family)